MSLVAVAALALSGCGSSAGGTALRQRSDTGPVPVVTSTNVWGDVVAQIGGEQVAVTAADQRSGRRPALLRAERAGPTRAVQGGAGGRERRRLRRLHADHAGLRGHNAPVITAVELFVATAPATPRLRRPGRVNEHVWYDLPDRRAGGDAGSPTELDRDQAGPGGLLPGQPGHLPDKLAGLTGKVDAIKAAHDGAEVAITEPVPLYLTEAAGLVNLTPDEFSEAIEEGTDVPPTVLATTRSACSPTSRSSSSCTTNRRPRRKPSRC